MKRYRLYSEWRENVVIGESLGDAIARAGLHSPDRYAEGKLIERGARHRIIRVIRAECVRGGSRGHDRPIYEAIVELENGRIEAVDAKLIEEITPGGNSYPVGS